MVDVLQVSLRCMIIATRKVWANSGCAASKFKRHGNSDKNRCGQMVDVLQVRLRCLTVEILLLQIFISSIQLGSDKRPSLVL